MAEVQVPQGRVTALGPGTVFHGSCLKLSRCTGRSLLGSAVPSLGRIIRHLLHSFYWKLMKVLRSEKLSECQPLDITLSCAHSGFYFNNQTLLLRSLGTVCGRQRMPLCSGSFGCWWLEASLGRITPEVWGALSSRGKFWCLTSESRCSVILLSASAALECY